MQKRTYILLTASALVLFLVSGILWFGASSMIAQKKEEDALRGEFQALVRKSKQGVTLRKTLDRATAIRANIQEFSFTVTDENQIQLISDLERIGKVTGVRAEVSDLAVASDLSQVSGGLSFVGEWKNIYHALQALEAYPIKVSILDVTINEDYGASLAAGSGKSIYRTNVKFIIEHARKP